MSKVYGYCRTARSGNIVEQQTLIMEYCMSNQMEIDEFFCDDGMSAHNLDRWALNKLLNKLQRGDVVIVKDISRLARDTKRHTSIMKKIYDVGAEVVYVYNNEFDTLSLTRWIEERWARQTRDE